jgi:uncharacterized membrane protein
LPLEQYQKIEKRRKEKKRKERKKKKIPFAKSTIYFILIVLGVIAN